MADFSFIHCEFQATKCSYEYGQCYGECDVSNAFIIFSGSNEKLLGLY